MEYLRVTMVCESLENIPQHALPPGYRMRLYRPGDRRRWVRIWQASERFVKVTARTFDAAFGADLRAMARRGLFLVAPDGRDVGTITAWYQRRYFGRPWGRIHWVAVLPAHRGRGLSKAMIRLRALGHRRVMLQTETPRLAAIRTYLGFGFVPDMRPAEAQRAWGLVAQALPGLLPA
jgi:GNAT superfamily N-acetyltransferase